VLDDSVSLLLVSVIDCLVDDDTDNEDGEDYPPLPHVLSHYEVSQRNADEEDDAIGLLHLELQID
jgi:hypothetical protein